MISRSNYYGPEGQRVVAKRKRSRLTNWMGGIALFLIASLTLLYVFRGPIVNFAMTPPNSFDETEHPAPPDYANGDHWAALPDRFDMADLVVAVDAGNPLLADRQQEADADVFYVHPTSLLLRINWNQPLDHALTNMITDDGVMRNEATVFNNCCRVYAPRYRQATLRAFSVEGDSGIKALDLAYTDVKAAFEYYLQNYNEGRPFIIAGHSQGSFHALRLIEEEEFTTILADKLVAAYLIGTRVPIDILDGENGGIRACQGAADTGCLISWNAYGLSELDNSWSSTRTREDNERIGERIGRENVQLSCINPVIWTTDETVAGAEIHGGSVWFNTTNNDPPGIDQNVVSAQCRDGLLRITRPTVVTYRLVMMGPDNYHAYNYGLFYMDLRKNALTRVNAWLAEASG